MAASKLASQRDATGPPQRMAVLMQQLDDLLLEAEEPYREAWTELKEGIAQLTAVPQIQVDNAHVTKLTRAVEGLILSQKKSSTPTAAPSFTAVLKVGLPAWNGLSAERETPTRLARELIVTDPDASPQDRGRPISQIVEGINKCKSASIPGKVLAARRLPSGDVLITTDMADTKTRLEQDPSWVPAVSMLQSLLSERLMSL